MRRGAIAAVAFLIAACTPMQWAKQDAAAEELSRDEFECQNLARSGANRAWYNQRMQGPIIGPGFVVWPSGAFVDPFANQLLDESRLAQFCMEARGYKLVPASPAKGKSTP